MLNTAVRDAVMRVLPRVKTPAQYIGGELNSIAKDHRQVRGKLCLASRHLHARHEPPRLAGALHAHEQRPAVGLRAGLHAVARLRGRAARATACRSTAWRRSRRSREFDVLGFSLQYEICYTNVLTMLDLGGIPPARSDRTRRPIRSSSPAAPGRRTRSCSPRSSTCSSSATARRACRGSWSSGCR